MFINSSDLMRIEKVKHVVSLLPYHFYCVEVAGRRTFRILTSSQHSRHLK